MECSNGPTDGVRNVTLASAENRTNVTLMCFPARSCVSLSVGYVTLITTQVHSNVTLAARNVTLTASGQRSRMVSRKVLDSGRWPGPPFGPRANPCSCAAHNWAEPIARSLLPVRALATPRRSALASPAILAGFGESLAAWTSKAAR